MVPAVVGDAAQVRAREDTGGARTGHAARSDDPQRLIQGISIQAIVVTSSGHGEKVDARNRTERRTFGGVEGVEPLTS